MFGAAFLSTPLESSSRALIGISMCVHSLHPWWSNYHLIMHATSLVRIQPTGYHEYSPSQLVLGKQPNISHLLIFDCAIYVPIAPTQCTKMSPQRRLVIYVGFDSPSIIRYLEPLTEDVFIARFTDCHFNENVFPPLGGEKLVPGEQ